MAITRDTTVDWMERLDHQDPGATSTYYLFKTAGEAPAG
jgi:hypothetical protein